MTSKFEQLIEYVINDDEAKAKELFHDIVVEKSREIYENLMTEEEEELEEAEELDEESTHDEDEKAEKAGRKVAKDIEYDDKKDRMDEEEEEMDESAMSEMMGGDASDDLIDDVETEETGMEMAEGEGEEELEDRVVDLEDKLDELMAEFEALMGDDAGDSVGDEMGGDDLEMDDTDTADFGMDGEEESEEEVEMGMMEAVSLAKVAPAKMGDDGANTKSVVPQNSGAKGAMASPVKMTGDTAQGRPAPKTGELIGKVQNSVGGDKKMSAAPKPVTAQASGVNTKTPFPKA
jgi:hypothetical protein